jgi:hypothetical protein
MHFFRVKLSTHALYLPRSQPVEHLVPTVSLHLVLANPIIAIDIPSTDPPRASKRTPPMQHSPVIKDQHPPRRQLLPVLILLLLQQRIKLPRSIVPRLHLINRQTNTRAIRTIPPHAQQNARRGIVFENWKATIRLNTNALVARSMSMDIYIRQDPVCIAICFVQLLGDFEAIDEQGRAAFAVGMGEEMECL